MDSWSQCFTTLASGGKLFLVFEQNFLHFSLCALHFILLLVTTKWLRRSESSYIFFTHPHEVFIHIVMIPAELSPSQSKQAQLFQIDVYVTDASFPSSSLWHFSALYSVQPCLSCAGEPRWDLTTAQQREWSICLSQQVMLFLMQSQVLLVCTKGK